MCLSETGKAGKAVAKDLWRLHVSSGYRLLSTPLGDLQQWSAILEAEDEVTDEQKAAFDEFRCQVEADHPISPEARETLKNEIQKRKRAETKSSFTLMELLSFFPVIKKMMSPMVHEPVLFSCIGGDGYDSPESVLIKGGSLPQSLITLLRDMHAHQLVTIAKASSTYMVCSNAPGYTRKYERWNGRTSTNYETEFDDDVEY